MDLHSGTDAQLLCQISPDYTLLGPQTAASIVEDVKDLFTWISTSLNTELSRSTSQLVNSDKIAVSGHSAGGYLSYIAVSSA